MTIAVLHPTMMCHCIVYYTQWWCITIVVLHLMMMYHYYCITSDDVPHCRRTRNDDVSLLLYYTQRWSVTITVLHLTMCITITILHFLAISKAAHKTWGGVGWKKQRVPTLHSSQRASQFERAVPFPFTTEGHTRPHSPVPGAWSVCSPWGSEVAPPSGDQTQSAGWPCRADRPPGEQQNRQLHHHHVCPNSRTVNTILITFVQTAEPSTPSSSRLSKQQNRQHHHVCPNSRTVNTKSS